MTLPVYPADREDKRKALLSAVEGVREVIEAGAEEGEANGTLPRATVDALYDAGLFAIKLPTVLGGSEADPMTQFDVIEAVSRIEPSAGWCIMIGSSSIGQPGAFLADAAIEQIFAGGRVPTAAAAAAQGGKAVPVEGGYILNGRWSFASGIPHAEWVRGGALVEREGDEPSRHIVAVMPASKVHIHDNWHVMGLRATGSNDFSVSDVFVPEAFTWDLWSVNPKRGGPLYRLGRPGFVAMEHSAFASGVAHRALDIIIDTAKGKERGYYNRLAVADRGSFQRNLGECDLRLKAIRGLVDDIYGEAWEVVCDGGTPEPRLQAEMRSSGTYSTQVATDVVTMALRYAGGAALQESETLQRCFRDMHAGAQHLMVSDRAYENHAQFLLGFPEANAMG